MLTRPLVWVAILALLCVGMAAGDVEFPAEPALPTPPARPTACTEQVLYVNVSSGNDTAGCGTTPALSCASIGAAIAEHLPGNCTRVLVAPGVYTGANNSDLTFPTDGVLQVEGAGATVELDLFARPQRRAFEVHNTPTGSLLAGFTVTSNIDRNNDSTIPPSANMHITGGAMHVTGAWLYVEDVHFTQNAVDLSNGYGSSGGAVQITGTSVVHLQACNFTDNHAVAGGGLYHAGTSRVTVWECRFENNAAVNGIGGGVVPEDASNGTYYRVTFYNNKAASGGGGDDGGTSHTLFWECEFLQNRADYGGGYYSFGQGSPTFFRCLFFGNEVTNSGGGLYGQTSSDIPVFHTRFESNVANGGGAARNNNGAYYFDNCTFVKNNGGSSQGVLNINTIVHMRNSTLRNNQALRVSTMQLGVNSASTFVDSHFIGNFGVEDGIAIDDGAQVNFTRCTFSGNVASRAAPIIRTQLGSHPRFVDCVFTGNVGRETGVAHITSLSEATFTNCTFRDNSVSKTGGVFYVGSSAKLNLESCLLTGNSARKAGGVFYIEGGTVRARNTTFRSNSAKFGAVAYVVEILPNFFALNSSLFNVDGACADDDPLFERCVFTENTATSVGSIVYWEAVVPDCLLVCKPLPMYANWSVLALLQDANTSSCTYLNNSADDAYGLLSATEQIHHFVPVMDAASLLSPLCASSAPADVPDTADVELWSRDQGFISLVPGSTFRLVFSGEDIFNETILVSDAFIQLSLFVVQYAPSFTVSGSEVTAPWSNSTDYKLTGTTTADFDRGLVGFTGLSLVGEPGLYEVRTQDAELATVALRNRTGVFTTYIQVESCKAGFAVRRDPFYRCEQVRSVESNDEAMSAIAITWSLLLICGTSIPAAVFIWCYRTHIYVRASSPFFCYLMAAGSVFGYVTVAFLGSDLDEDYKCTIPPVAASTWFAMVFGSLLAKNHRIHRIFNGKPCQYVSLPNKELVRKIAYLLGLDFVVHLLWNVTDQPHPELVSDPTQQFTDLWSCESEYMWMWLMMLTVPKLVLLGYATFIAWKVRKVALRFNESKYIGYAIQNMFIVVLLGGGLYPVVRRQLTAEFVLFFILLTFLFLGTVLIIFLPKVYFVRHVDAARLQNISSDVSSAVGVPGKAGASRSKFSGSSATSAVFSADDMKRRMDTQKDTRHSAARTSGVTARTSGAKRSMFANDQESSSSDYDDDSDSAHSTAPRESKAAQDSDVDEETASGSEASEDSDGDDQQQVAVADVGMSDGVSVEVGDVELDVKPRSVSVVRSDGSVWVPIGSLTATSTGGRVSVGGTLKDHTVDEDVLAAFGEWDRVD